MSNLPMVHARATRKDLREALLRCRARNEILEHENEQLSQAVLFLSKDVATRDLHRYFPSDLVDLITSLRK